MQVQDRPVCFRHPRRLLQLLQQSRAEGETKKELLGLLPSILTKYYQHDTVLYIDAIVRKRPLRNSSEVDKSHTNQKCNFIPQVKNTAVQEALMSTLLQLEEIEELLDVEEK